MLFFGLFSWLLLPVGIVLLIVLLVRRKDQNPNPSVPYSYDATSWHLQERNLEWVRFIEAYDDIARTPEEKQLIRHILYDAATQGLGVSELAHQYLGRDDRLLPEAALTPAPVQAYAPAETPAPMAYAAQQPAVPPQPIDNTSLLLYFGAFLFVASVGLFIAFGGASGTLRTVAVVLVMGVMYAGGQWLYRTKPKLQQAGLAFAAIGIVIAPLLGLAFYEYVFTKQHGALVWLLTSAFCMVLYAHALITLKKPLISYILIFTFLSLFESGISVVQVPVYYFGWGIAFTGIILQALSRWKGYFPELRESSRYSSLFLLPLALVASLGLIVQQGSGQLGVSLLLAALFYGLEALATKHGEQEANAVVSQLAAIAGAVTLVYALSHRWLLAVVALLAANALQALIMMLANVHGRLWHNFGSVLLCASAIDVLLAVGKSESLLPATAGLAVIAILVWWRQRRADAYGLGALALMALPYIYGQVTARPHMAAGAQTVLALMTLLVLLLSYLLQYHRAKKLAGWTAAAEVTYVLGAASVAFASCFGSPLLCLNVAIGLAATLVSIAEYTKRHDWADAAVIFLAVPIIRGWADQPILLASILAALVASISLSLRYRRELLRWASTLLWLVLPLGLGSGVFGGEWHAAGFAWSYLLVLLALLISRAIARGVLFFSSRIPLAAYARSASLSYTAGYIAAACVAVGCSLGASASRIHTTLILVALVPITVIAALRVEKKPDALALLPLLGQALLLSGVRPEDDGTRLTAFLLASTALSAVTYLFVATMPRTNAKSSRAAAYLIQQASVVMAFVSPSFVVFYGGSYWAMPLGLLVAGALLSHRLRTSAQAYRELAGAAVTLSLLWFLGIAHVHALQAYVHVIIANLALYAYWRARRGETAASDSYLWSMLAVATVPLGMQALAGAAGGLYGWWLLLEQVVFVLLGMGIRRRFVTYWGLYVAVGATLFQLRHLGWAALTVLALFLIGIAIYQLQKHSDSR